MSPQRPSQVHADFMHENTDSQEAIAQHDGLDFSFPLSGTQGATPHFPSDGDSTLTLRPTKRIATAPASPQRSPKRIFPKKSPSVQSAPADLASAFHPNEFDFAITDANFPNTAKSTVDATAIAEFLSAIEKHLATPPEQRRTPRQNLQSFLIQQQLVAGIPVDKLEPMSGPGSRQSQGIPRLFNTPTALTYFNDATYIPAIPPAQFNGSVTPLPIHPSLPNPPHAEQIAISNFYTTHFATGSGILGQPAAASPAASVLESTTIKLGHDSEHEILSPVDTSENEPEKEAL
ncbi:uncharacterized protein N7477_007658 [Penicillium maclennaniae]|uniref:uncharacterized protein n=1 Tax=Penicillium maclennaniae TaxID=1343394 RepID=UPI00254199A6|nr:uncharacterized protein N7477_007658 [Penicillium maclennaniae]KAJ5665210.1 hypothetical protein N7477_007658 [Penicillium maclennaniae]